MTQYIHVYIQIFQGESEFSGFRGFQYHPVGLGERRKQHCHGLGQEVDNALLSAFNIYVYRSIFQGKPEFRYFRNTYSPS